MEKKKHNDCFICAYAEAEKIGWKQSKRRLSKVLTSRKKLGVDSNKLKRLGVKGFEVLTNADAKSMAHLMKFNDGIVCISFGNGNGHAVYWDGAKLVDNIERGRISKFNNESGWSDINIICILRRRKCKLKLTIKNKITCLTLSIKSKIARVFTK